MSELTVSIVVPTYNRAGLLKDVLQSLVDQTLDRTRFEVIVVDNNSTDETEVVVLPFIERHKNFRYVKEGEPGASHARNRGYAEARGAYVAYIDDDAMALPDWAGRILNAFNTVKPEPVAVGGEIHPWYEKPPPGWFADELEIRTWGTEKGFLQPPRAQRGFSGPNMAFRKSILETYGGFSAEYGPVGKKLRFGEEPHLFNRLYKDHPWFWYDPAIRVKHLVSARKMSVLYRISRDYQIGIASARIHGKSAADSIIWKLRFLVSKSLLLPFRVRWWQKDWQRDFLVHARPVARSLGFFKTILTGK
jgi:glycosyltransferase involved in cell wall biosynthesis